MASSERRVGETANSEWRIANGEWSGTADREWPFLSLLAPRSSLLTSGPLMDTYLPVWFVRAFVDTARYGLLVGANHRVAPSQRAAHRPEALHRRPRRMQ
jgi:hypothetical protein